MDPAFQFRAKQVLETEDIAADFVENELGRHDWMRNWPVYKSKPDLRERIATWLKHSGYTSADPADVEEAIERFLRARPGRWR